ncbi:MAG: hypothetical protein R3C28_11270 [Pirellulaceae bacterium]
MSRWIARTGDWLAEEAVEAFATRRTDGAKQWAITVVVDTGHFHPFIDGRGSEGREHAFPQVTLPLIRMIVCSPSVSDIADLDVM